MQITEVRVKLMDDPQERLLAFCSVTFDAAFVIRDLKLIRGKTAPFVAMPSRKLADRCPRCHNKNHLRAAYCNGCGARLSDERAVKDEEGRAKLYADIAHPINSLCRELIQTEVASAYERELVLSRQLGYVCSYDDFGEDRFAELEEEEVAPVLPARPGLTHRVEAAHAAAAGGHATEDAPRRTASSRATTVEVADRGDAFGEGLA